MDKRKSNKKEIESQLNSVQTELKDGVFIFSGPITIGEFAHAINKPAVTVIAHFFKQGKMLNINSSLDEEQIAELCIEYGYDFSKESEVNAQNFMDQIEIKDEAKDLVQRPAIITIMGHVDHGKTTLIDRIRNANVAATEAGGITQHTGAYQVTYKGTPITFLDTPGHEAFTAMRARGAKLTDIVVLVVAADDGVMPQTKEAIEHAIAAEVQIIVFVNKMDKPGADVERVKSELSKVDIVSEEWGGNYQFVYGSGLTGEGIDKLFEAINLQAEMLELKANPNRLPVGVIVESRLDKGKGPIATMIVQHGTLYARDFVVAGSKYGKIRTLTNTQNKTIEFATPGTPVIITGLSYVPNAGDKFFGFKDEKFAKKLAEDKEFADKQQELKSRSTSTHKEGLKVINVILKADVQGTTEALKYSLSKLENDEAKVHVVRAAVGTFTESDVLLAQASKAILYGFNIKPSADIKEIANQKKVEIRTNNVIYKIIEELEGMLNGLKMPKYEEKYLGEATVVKTFFYSKVGTIAGCMVQDGVIKSTAIVRVIRNSKIIFEGKLDSLQRGKDLTKSVEKGKDCGLHVKDFDDIKEFDIIKAYEIIEVKSA